MIPQDSAKFWFPKLARYNSIREWLPNTVLVDYNEELLTPSLMGQTSKEYERLYYAVEAAIRYEIGGPAFIRTDITSAKHAGSSAWKVENEDALNDALLTTLSASQLKTYHSKVKASAIMVRPLLDLKGTRTAFGGLPIGKEIRIFVKEEAVQCWHGYWPQEALQNHMDDGLSPSLPDWSDGIPTDDLFAMNMVARDAAKAMEGGKWSVDFAQDVHGKWWLLDMATAGNSYHAECEFKDLDKPNAL